MLTFGGIVEICYPLKTLINIQIGYAFIGFYRTSTESKKRPEDCKASNVTSAIAITIGEGKGFVTDKDHCRYLGGYKVRAVAKF